MSNTNFHGNFFLIFFTGIAKFAAVLLIIFFFFRFSMLTDGSNWTMCWLKWSTTWTPSSCYFVHLTPYVFDFSDQFVKLCVEKKEERRERHAHTFREPWWTKQISVDIDYDYMSLYLLHSSNSLIFHFSSVRFWYGLKMVLILQWTLQTYPVFHAFICNLSCARNAITLGIFRVCTTFRPRNEIANADKKNNTVIIMFKASDANETNANNKTSAKRARDMHTTAAEWKERVNGNTLAIVTSEWATKSQHSESTLFVGLIIINFN